MTKHATLGAALVATLIWSGTASACPPPAPVAVARMPDETEEAYYDRLIAGSWPNSWRAMYAVWPTQNAGESDADFAARMTAWQAADRRASEAAYERSQGRRRAALLAEESARWGSDQIVLAESLGGRAHGNFAVTRFRIIDRSGQTARERVFTLRYPFAQTSCDYGPPSFAAGTRWVMFAGTGPITNENLIGYYDLQSAQDPRTRRWLEGVRPDGMPLPAPRQ